MNRAEILDEKKGISNEEKLKGKIKNIQKNFRVFFSLSVNPESELFKDGILNQIEAISEYLLEAESKEELEFYTDSLDSMLTLIRHYHSDFLIIQSSIEKFLALLDQYEKDQLSYEELKKEFFLIRSSFQTVISKICSSSQGHYLHEFLKTRATDFQKLINETSILLSNNEPNDGEKNKLASVLKQKFQSDFSSDLTSGISSSIDKSTILASCQNSLDEFKKERLPQLKTLDNTKEFLLQVGITALTVVSSSSIGSSALSSTASKAIDISTNCVYAGVSRARFWQKKNFSRAVSFACGVIGLVCMLPIFPGSQLVGLLLLSESILSLSTHVLKYSKKYGDCLDSEFRTQKRMAHVTETFEKLSSSIQKKEDKSTRKNSISQNKSSLWGNSQVEEKPNKINGSKDQSNMTSTNQISH